MTKFREKWMAEVSNYDISSINHVFDYVYDGASGGGPVFKSSGCRQDFGLGISYFVNVMNILVFLINI